MTEKDYNLIAEAIYEVDISQAATEIVAEALAVRLRTDNPRFDREKFIKACLGE